MALVAGTRVTGFKSTSISNPTIRLEQALNEFEKNLSDTLKSQYRNSTSKPDISSVIAFIAQIDANNVNRTRRCVAPRLHTFLERVQQFSAVVDSYVQSKPDLAALVWGSVKLTMLAASNIASYFEKVTSMIMEVGKICPTYQQFGELYPGCIGLQNALCDHYAVIIQLCSKIVEVLQRSSWKQTLSSIVNPFELEFKPLRESLDQAVRGVHIQILYASSQSAQEAKHLIEHEGKQNAKHRQRVLGLQWKTQRGHDEAQVLRLRTQKREMAKMKNKIRQNLSEVNYEKPWKQALRQKVGGTAEWLTKDAVFRQWVEDPVASILWCSGTMGTGKTILTSNVVAQLHASCKSNDVIAYYFCQAENEPSLLAKNILGSLALQMLHHQIEEADYDTLCDLCQATDDLDAEGVADFLLPHLQSNKGYYIVVDGLDECETSDIRAVATALTNISSKDSIAFNIFYAGRPELEQTLFRAVEPWHRIAVNPQNTQSDMVKYICSEVDRCLDDGDLVLGDQRLRSQISDALQQGSHGMFLWTKLMIHELCAQNSDADILRALEHLPAGLSEVFELVMYRVQKQNGFREALRLIEFCGVVTRPLTLLQYRELLSIEPGQKSLDHSMLPNDMQRIITDCCGLTFVDEEDLTVHYVHRSIEKYFFSTDASAASMFDPVEANLKLGYLCMTYVHFGDFQTQLTKAHKQTTTQFQPIQLGTSSLADSRTLERGIAKLLLWQTQTSRHTTLTDFESKIQQTVDQTGNLGFNKASAQEYHFHEYARTCWFLHLHDLHPLDGAAWHLFCQSMRDDQNLLSKPCKNGQHGPDHGSEVVKAVRWILDHSHKALLVYYIRHETAHRTTVLECIFDRLPSEPSCDALASLVYQEVNEMTEAEVFMLFFATKHNHIGVMKSLIEAGADVNASGYEWTPLTLAANQRHVEILEMLIETGADVNLAAEMHGWEPLMWAMDTANLEIIDILIAAGADINLVGKKGITPLSYAITMGRFEIFDRLIEAGANINQTDHDGDPPLTTAARNGRIEIVQKLMAAGADTNPAREDQSTPMYWAILRRDIEMVDLLMTAISINIAGTKIRQTPLFWAASEGNLEITKKLIAAGADVNCTDLPGHTPIMVGIRELKIVDSLIAAGADVNHVDKKGRSPLIDAAQTGSFDSAKRLIEAGANVKQRTNIGETALSIAIEEGHSELAKLLKKAGAKK